MGKGRLEAFSDGVLAIIITVMLLELKIPHSTTLSALRPTLPVFLSYVLSFVYIAIYWNNHHHMMHTVRSVTGRIMWSNMHLLFWLSLIPFVSGWLGENGGGAWPTALYGFVLFMAGTAYLILQSAIVAHEGKESKLAHAVGRDLKGRLSQLLYAVAIALSFFSAGIAYVLNVLVALMWIVPDRRIERDLHS